MNHLAPSHPLSPENDYAQDEKDLLEYRRVCDRAINSMRANAELLESLNTINGKALAQKAKDLIEDLQVQLHDEGLCSDEECEAPHTILPDYTEFLIESGRHPRFAAE